MGRERGSDPLKPDEPPTRIDLGDGRRDLDSRAGAAFRLPIPAPPRRKALRQEAGDGASAASLSGHEIGY